LVALGVLDMESYVKHRILLKGVLANVYGSLDIRVASKFAVRADVRQHW
jgi:hypothetical protein